MSGLAAILAGHLPPGVYRWQAAFDVEDVRRAVEHAGFGFGYVDGWTAPSKRELLAAVGVALGFPETYGKNLDALADLLRGVATDEDTVLLWDGWSTLARADDRAFRVVLRLLEERTGTAPAAFAVLLRGDGPALPEVARLD